VQHLPFTVLWTQTKETVPITQQIRHSPQHPESGCIQVVFVSRRSMFNSPSNTPWNTKLTTRNKPKHTHSNSRIQAQSLKHTISMMP
jgi:hypothetical protein